MAASTRKAHTCQINCYSNFCSRYGLVAFPCNPQQACLYAAFLSEWMAPSSIINYLSAIWRRQQSLNFPSHASHYLLRQTLRGIKRSLNRRRPPRLALSTLDLHQLLGALNTLLPEDLIFWSATTLAFRALLRCSHYTRSSHTLCWGDISMFPDHIILVLRTSKTDQFSEFPHRIIINSSPGSRLCPVFWLWELLRVFHPSSSDPIFCIPTPTGLVPISSSWYNGRLKNIAAKLGLEHSRISSHSLRHGGASFMSALGCDIMDIRARGSWASSAIFRYLHHSDLTLKEKDFSISQKFY